MTAALAAGTLVFALSSGSTLSGWTQAKLANSTDSAATGSLSFTHAYQSTNCSAGPSGPAAVACAGSIAPTAATPASGSVTGTDAITNTSAVPASSLSASVSAASCAPAQFANAANSGNPLLARYGMQFNTSGPFSAAGSVTLPGGAAPSGYATSVVQQTQPPGVISLLSTYGVGIWFKAAPGVSGPLFSFGVSASNGGGNADRILYLNSSGQLSITYNTSGTVVGPSSKSGGYADNSWHFAYATFGGVNILIGPIPQVTLYVDGVQVAQTPLISLAGYTPYAGYWHLGYAPTGGQVATPYFAGSLSNFVVFDNNPAPSGTTNPNTQAAFNAFASSATEWWPLNDPGTTTYTGTLPTSMSSPCGMIALSWTFANPAATAASGTTLGAFANGSAHTVAVPGPGATQTSTITTGRASGYNTDVSGLHLLVPWTYRVSTTHAPGWSFTFTWSAAASVIIA